MKKVWLVLCMVTTMIVLTACGANKPESSSKFDEAKLKEDAAAYFQWFDKEGFKDFLPEHEGEEVEIPEELIQSFGEEFATKLITECPNYKKLKDSLGDFVKESSIKIEYVDGNASVIYTAEYENNKLVQTTLFDSKRRLLSLDYEQYRTFTQIIQKALMNTLMGMGVVFAVLIFISFIIYLLKFVPVIIDKLSGKNKVTTVVKTPVIPVMEEDEEEADDGELVAVITAAIMAGMSEEEKANGLVVRSIRKINKSKWKNA